MGSFLDTVLRAKAYLGQQGRVSLRGLRREFDLDEDALEELIEELVDIQHVAAREGKALSWIGATAARARDDPAAPIEAAARGSEAITAADAERRQLTVMLCDLVGSTISGSASTQRTFAASCAPIRRRRRRRSSATRGTSRSSWATGCWSTSAIRRRTRTTPSAPCAPGSRSSPRSAL